MRTFALYQRDRRVLVLLLGVVFVTLGIAFVGSEQLIIAGMYSDPPV
jgi:hypothetical protein